MNTYMKEKTNFVFAFYYRAKVVKAFLLIASVVALSLVSAGSANAACPAGYTCFADVDTSGRSGRVAGWNDDWGRLPGGWDNRADVFINRGTTHHIRLFSGLNRTGAHRNVRRGKKYGFEWKNIVSSNSWYK